MHEKLSGADLQAATGPLLGPGDPPPAEIINEDAAARVLLICDHAGIAVPRKLDNLGLEAPVLQRHIGWDIGAGPLTRELARRLGMPAVMGAYSRLVMDNNREPEDPTSIAEISDGVIIPGNRGLSEAARAARAAAVFYPYHDAIEARIEAMLARGDTPVLISVHSYTPEMRNFERPWQVGVLWNQDGRLSRPLIAALRGEKGLSVGDNEPYSARDGYGYSTERHGESRGLASALLEIRQDQIDTADGLALWSERLQRVFGAVLADEGLYKAFGS